MHESKTKSCQLVQKLILLVFILLGAGRLSGQWAIPDWTAPSEVTHPSIACTGRELARLKAAFRESGLKAEAVRRVVESAQSVLDREIVFPPRGGQHNQWYQCDRCQVALETVSPTRHRCPKCGRIYSGPPYDDVIFSKVHARNMEDMANSAWAYALTGEERFAEFAAKILIGYAERYESYPYHTNRADPADRSPSGGHIEEQTLGEASMMARRIAPGYDLIYDSEVLSEVDRELIREGLFLPMLANIDKYKAGKSNWQTWHNAAMLAGGAVIGEFQYVTRAISNPQNGFAFQMVNSVTDDGMWYENSWGYHFYTLDALVSTAESARRIGIDLWSHPNLKKMFILPAYYTMPNGALPRFGDDVNSSAQRVPQLMEPAYAVYRDARIQTLLPRNPNWYSVMYGRRTDAQPPEPIQMESIVFESAGHGILRGGGELGLATVETFGPFGGFHGHFDKLSFVFYAMGRELGVDPGRARSQAYRLPIHRDWYRASLSHNVVLVDRKSQQPAEGELVFFGANGGYSALVTRCRSAYENVDHRRMLCQTPTYLVVIDFLTAENERQFDWVYHNRGDVLRSSLDMVPGTFGQPFPGMEYLDQLRGAVVKSDVRLEFVGDGVSTHLYLKGEWQDQLWLGTGPGATIEERIPFVMLSRRGFRPIFASVLEPLPAGQPSRLRKLEVKETGTTHQVRLDFGSRIDRFVIDQGRRISMFEGNEQVFGASRFE
jgi:hypothetical protein